MPSLFIFRRDLRLQDNTALIESLKQSGQNSDSVIPVFIFDDRQIKNNDYFSEKGFSFMINSLNELNDELKKLNSRLFFFQGISHEVIEKLIKHFNHDSNNSDVPNNPNYQSNRKIKALYINKDYTPFSIKRDSLIKQVCNKYNVKFYSFSDALLNEPGTLKTYIVFTPFWKAYSKIPVKKPQKNNYKNYYKGTNKIDFEASFEEIKNALKEKLSYINYKAPDEILSNLTKLSNYEEIRNFPSKETSYLSAHLKFGTISARQAFYEISEKLMPFHPLLRQLYWRDFFYHIAYHFPDVFGNPFNRKYQKIKWEFDEKKFNAWKNGLTGFPIVDAGMRQLNQTGYMHNRVRMIVASFLTKDLHIDWRSGEKYFAQKLIDYDPCINNGNWQWASSVGCDAQPYFRIFNPLLQQKKFDPFCEYIKKWLPELKNLSYEQIHNIENIDLKFLKINYPKPILNHAIESKKAIWLYKNI